MRSPQHLTTAEWLIRLSLLLTCIAGLQTHYALAQESIPTGTVLPIRLNNSLSVKKSKAGQQITGRIMQDVPLGGRNSIHDGAKVTGHIIAVAPATSRGDSEISFKFDSIEINHRLQPIITNLRALASPLEVDDAQLPFYGGDRGTPSTAYTTTQIGGEIVYRGGGHVERDDKVVGEPVYGGVLVRVSSSSREGKRCRGEIGENNGPQALWLFSSDACGLYGYQHVSIGHAGRTNPMGEIVLSSDDGNLLVRSGSGMLLRVDAQ